MAKRTNRRLLLVLMLEFLGLSFGGGFGSVSGSIADAVSVTAAGSTSDPIFVCRIRPVTD